MDNNNKIKVLHFIYGLHVGGAETFIINVITALDSDRFSFDFAIQDSEVTNPILLEMIATKRIKIYNIPKFPRYIAAQYKSLKHLLEVHSYDVVHIHMNAAVNPVPLLISKTMWHKGIKFIVHSHNSSNNFGGKIGKIIHHLNSRFLIDTNCEKVACSDLAGRWMFGNDHYTIIANAVDTQRYEFNINSRTKIRRELCISDDNVVIGNIGRFVHAKNHRFMIDFFANYSKTHPNVILLLVGTGPLFEETRTHAHNIGLDEKVIFTGLRTDIPELLSAMDCFFFPSIFEGLGFVAIEAEAAGLHVVASDTIPTDINQQQYVKFLSLKDSYSNWTYAVDSAIEQTRSSNRESNPIKGSRFDIKIMIDHLEKIYLS